LFVFLLTIEHLYFQAAQLKHGVPQCWACSAMQCHARTQTYCEPVVTQLKTGILKNNYKSVWKKNQDSYHLL
jgi:hypothetical protein